MGMNLATEHQELLVEMMWECPKALYSGRCMNHIQCPRFYEKIKIGPPSIQKFYTY
jgi:hypothetical protein